MKATTLAPDIERAACTILAQARGGLARRELIQWVDRILAEPSFSENIDGSTADMIVNRRRVVRDASSIANEFGCGIEEAASEYAEWIGTEWPTRLGRNLDHAALLLGYAVVGFRSNGRPAGDVTSEIGGVYTVTTSLAAAVARYVSDIQNAYAEELQGR